MVACIVYFYVCKKVQPFEPDKKVIVVQSVGLMPFPVVAFFNQHNKCQRGTIGFHCGNKQPMAKTPTYPCKNVQNGLQQMCNLSLSLFASTTYLL